MAADDVSLLLKRRFDMNGRQVVRITVIAIASILGSGTLSRLDAAPKPKGEFTTNFYLQDCQFQTTGNNPYFILQPGYRLVLEEEADGEIERVQITVLDDTEAITVPGLGTVTTRVVEEVETVGGELVEVSRNFFAICGGRNDAVYFGEDVDIHNPDGSITHEGEWRAGQPDGSGLAEPGIIMPGTFLLGSRYFQELADEIALDRAEHAAMGFEVTTDAGTFSDCVRIVETSPLEPKSSSTKVYCRGIGLVMDSGTELVEYGFVP
jgi:hypothetical protein